MGKVLDSELVLMLHASDVKAFNLLYGKYHQALYSNILKFTKSDQSARDILQEVFLTLWEKRLYIDESQSVSGWLFVVSYNKSMDFLRRKVAESTAQSLIQSDELCENSSISAEESRYQVMQQAIERLSVQKRKVFTMCKVEGKSYSEAASELNISKNTVKEHLSLAVTSVKDFIRRHQGHWKTAAIAVVLEQLVLT